MKKLILLSLCAVALGVAYFVWASCNVTVCVWDEMYNHPQPVTNMTVVVECSVSSTWYGEYPTGADSHCVTFYLSQVPCPHNEPIWIWAYHSYDPLKQKATTTWRGEPCETTYVDLYLLQ